MDQALADALVETLKANATIAAMVQDRIFDRRLPQKFKRPAIVYAATNTEFQETVGGYSRTKGATDLQIRCLAERSPAARRLAKLVADGLANHKGDHPGCRIDGVLVLSQESGEFEPGPASPDEGTYEETLSITVEFTLYE